MTIDPAQDAFFTLHRDLPREGPGVADDVAWAASLLDLPANARLADVACGPGADIAALLEAAPLGHVTALDKTAHFVQAARDVWHDDPRVTVLRADMAAIANDFHMIWCAGAVYFMGIEAALAAWRKSVKKGGVIAFSEACWFTDAPSERAKAFWNKSNPAMTDTAGITAQIAAAGYEIIGQRRLPDAAWEAYYTPLEARITLLREGADDALNKVLDEAVDEIECWRGHRKEFGYLLSVVRPL